MDSTLALGAFRIARGAGGEAVDVNGNLVEREVPPGGAEGSFLCSLSSRFSGRGGGGGEPPQGVAASWGASVGERKNKNCQNPRVDPCLSFTLLGSPTSRSFCFSEYNVKFDESRPHFL